MNVLKGVYSRGQRRGLMSPPGAKLYDSDATRKVLCESEVKKTFWNFFPGPPGSTKSKISEIFMTPTFDPKVSQKWRISSFSAWSRRAVSQKYTVHHMKIKIKKNNFSVFDHFYQKMAKNDQKTPKSAEKVNFFQNGILGAPFLIMGLGGWFLRFWRDLGAVFLDTSERQRNKKNKV